MQQEGHKCCSRCRKYFLSFSLKDIGENSCDNSGDKIVMDKQGKFFVLRSIQAGTIWKSESHHIFIENLGWYE